MIKKLVIGFALFFVVFGFLIVLEYGPEITSGAVAWGGPKCVKSDRAEKLIGNGWCEQVSNSKCESKGKIMVECSGTKEKKEEKREEIKQKVQDWRASKEENKNGPESSTQITPEPVVEPEPATEPEPAPEPTPEPAPQPSEPIVTEENN